MPEPTAPPWGEVQTRALAAFLGLAIGDAFGATTEFMTAHEIQLKYGVLDRVVGGGWLNLKPGRVTDDTEMSIYLARAILSRDTWDLTAVADHFVAWMRSKPIDIGSTCARGIRQYLHHGTLEMPPNEWDAGNGALMRILPVALFTLGDDRQLCSRVVQQAHLTHNHPLSDGACITVGRMVQRALLEGEGANLRALAKELVGEHPKFRFRPYLKNSSPYVADTVQTVFHYLFTTGTFEDCLVGVVNQGGDADTTGAIAGMIAGAFYGLDAIPKRWLKKLHAPVRSEVEELALQLIERSPLRPRAAHT